MKHTSFYLLADNQSYSSLSSAVHKAVDDMQANGVVCTCFKESDGCYRVVWFV